MCCGDSSSGGSGSDDTSGGISGSSISFGGLPMASAAAATSVAVASAAEVQGHPTQTVFFETTLTDRNIKWIFALNLVLECWDNDILV